MSGQTDGTSAHGTGDTIIDLDTPFVDARGAIQPLIEAQMKSALLIESKAGAVRADHYHYTDWHYLSVLSGEMTYYYRPVGSEDAPKVIIVRAGELVFTPPMMEHRTDFPMDTVCLTLSRNARDQAAYEADVVRIQMPIEGAVRVGR